MSGLVLKTRIDIETGQTEIVVLSTVFKSHKTDFMALNQQTLVIHTPTS